MSALPTGLLSAGLAMMCATRTLTLCHRVSVAVSVFVSGDVDVYRIHPGASVSALCFTTCLL
jgi:hypothetical protein